MKESNLMIMIASTPTPPYYAVIFTSIRTADDEEDYQLMSEKMVELAKKQPGFLGVESARNEVGITVSYWRDTKSIRQWKMDVEHLAAQQQGRSTWYAAYKTRISLVERDYEF